MGIFCKDCDAWIKWTPKAWSWERADGFVMPFGKHKGTTMGRLRDMHKDYLFWLVKALEPDSSARKAAEVLLGNEKA